MDRFTVRFWGVRGSIAGGGRGFAKLGGNTSYGEIRVNDESIILDAGTGLFRLGESLAPPVRATFLIRHYHSDHIQGFPSFRPACAPANAFTLYGPQANGYGVEEALARQMEGPHFPVPLRALAARRDFHALRPGDEIRIGPAHVRTAALNHPQGCLGYRVSLGETSVVYATDTEPIEPGVDGTSLLELARDAAVLISDAQYTDGEYLGRSGTPRRGWGHSTVRDACRVAQAAHVRQLVLFHHDPTHSDRTVERMVREARGLFPQAVTACEGMRLQLLPHAEHRAGVGRRGSTAAVRLPDPYPSAEMVCTPDVPSRS